MSNKKRRRRFTAAQKAAILERLLFEQAQVSDLADEYQVNPSLLYHWQRQVRQNLVATFEVGTGTSRLTVRERALQERVEGLQARLTNKDRVIAEISEEFVKLKKNDGNP